MFASYGVNKIKFPMKIHTYTVTTTYSKNTRGGCISEVKLVVMVRALTLHQIVLYTYFSLNPMRPTYLHVLLIELLYN